VLDREKSDLGQKAVRSDGRIPQLAIFSHLNTGNSRCLSTVVGYFTRLLSWQPIGGLSMSKKAAEHHHKAAEHHEHAARHHKEAAKHHEAGKYETAAHHAHLARGHHEHAKHHAAEAAKAHIEEHGKAIPAHA
jgi:hypothetical protein